MSDGEDVRSVNVKATFASEAAKNEFLSGIAKSKRGLRKDDGSLVSQPDLSPIEEPSDCRYEYVPVSEPSRGSSFGAELGKAVAEGVVEGVMESLSDPQVRQAIQEAIKTQWRRHVSPRLSDAKSKAGEFFAGLRSKRPAESLEMDDKCQPSPLTEIVVAELVEEDPEPETMTQAERDLRQEGIDARAQRLMEEARRIIEEQQRLDSARIVADGADIEEKTDGQLISDEADRKLIESQRSVASSLDILLSSGRDSETGSVSPIRSENRSGSSAEHAGHL